MDKEGTWLVEIAECHIYEAVGFFENIFTVAAVLNKGKIQTKTTGGFLFSNKKRTMMPTLHCRAITTGDSLHCIEINAILDVGPSHFCFHTPCFGRVDKLR